MSERIWYDLGLPEATGLVSGRVETALADCLQVRRYFSVNWFSSEGVCKKRKAIERKGLPSFFRWRFITLTLSRKVFDGDPLAGYLWGRAHLREFLKACRKAGLWSDSARWAWKLEFQRDGWAHWHLLVDRRAKFSVREMTLMDSLWKCGSTSVEMVRQSGFLYSFKYAFKPVLQEKDVHDWDSARCVVPDWFADYMGSKTVLVDGVEVRKPVSFARARFWQTSKGFYTNSATVKREAKEAVSAYVPHPVRVAVDSAPCRVQIIGRDRCGRYKTSCVVRLVHDFGKLATFAGWLAVGGAAVWAGINSFFLPLGVLKKQVEKQTLWRMKEIADQSGLTMRGAMFLTRTGRIWATC